MGSFNPNPWGLYDMHGNVFQWCADRYGPYPTGAVADPRGPESGEDRDRVMRGGCWFEIAETCRSARRVHEPAGRSNFIFGFRIVLRPRDGAP